VQGGCGLGGGAFKRRIRRHLDVVGRRAVVGSVAADA